MPRVLLLATGDVIAYSIGSEHPGLARGAALLGDLPPGALAADVVVEDVLAEPGWDTSPATMLALARRVRSALLDDGVAGVVVTHGLDTIEDAAFLVDLVLGDAAHRGGVVLTGAVRPRDALSPDGPRNLASAVAAACSPAVRGVGAVLCLGEELHAARWATLVDAHSPVGLSSAPHGVLARVHDGAVHPCCAPPPRPPALGGEPDAEVALIKTYPGMDAALLSTVVDRGSRGVVLEGTGAGNVPAELFTTIHELTSWDVPVVVASRARTHGTLDGPVPGGLAAAVGAIGARGLRATAARYALMAALTTGGVEACRAWFAAL